MEVIYKLKVYDNLTKKFETYDDKEEKKIDEIHEKLVAAEIPHEIKGNKIFIEDKHETNANNEISK